MQSVGAANPSVQYTSIITGYIKVKCTLVQALKLCTGRTARRGSRGIALLFNDHGTGRGWEVSVTPRPLFTPGKDAVPIVQEVRWAPGPIWTGAKNLAPTGIRSPDRPASSYTDYVTRPTTWYIVGSIWRKFWGRQLPGSLRSCRDRNRASYMKQAVQELWCDVEHRRENLIFHILKHLGDVNTAWDVDSIYPPKRQ
jgi:hypothetical protein